MSNTQMDSMNTNPQANTAATNAPQNAYEYTEEEKKEYGAFNLNTAFARAWSRARRYGFNFGSPIEEPQQQSNNTHRQKFQYGYAVSADTNNENQNVQFYDGRGFIIQDSGL